MKIVEYSSVPVQEVRDLIKLGFQPWGSPFVGDKTAYQAMVKYEETDKITASNGFDESNISIEDVEQS